MNAREFCVSWVTEHSNKDARILDYGCGSGEIVADLRAHGFEAFGCDVFYDGGNFARLPEATPYISSMDSRIPFDDGSFDLVLSNSVLEHVSDLAAVVAETARVLRPRGTALHVFPDRGTWWEGHVSMPFLHWFPKGQLRLQYAVAMSHVPKLGLPLNGRTRQQRYAAKCIWLDEWTHYRSLGALHSAFSGSFDVEHAEELRFDAKFGPRAIPVSLKRWLIRKLAGNVLVLTKSDTHVKSNYPHRLGGHPAAL